MSERSILRRIAGRKPIDNFSEMVSWSHNVRMQIEIIEEGETCDAKEDIETCMNDGELSKGAAASGDGE